MCGIIGYVTNKFKHNHVSFMEQGLVVDSLRGMCGTGIYSWDPKQREMGVYKRALTGADFVNSKQFDMWKANAYQHQVVIGHNRASTIGAAKDQNCHPFVYDNIALVHNGTLRNHTSLFKAGEFTHNVDSAYAAKAIATYGVMNALPKIDGAFVFVWHDADNNTFNIARNSMRDIWYITDKEGDNLYYASEYEMLAWLLDRNNHDTHGKYKSPAELTVLSWELDKPLTKPKVVAFDEYKPPKYEYPRQHNGYFKGRNRDAEDLAGIGVEQYELLEVVEWVFEPYASDTLGKGKVIGKCRVGEGDHAKIINFKVHNAAPLDKAALESAEKSYVGAVSLWYENVGQEQVPYIICRQITCKSANDDAADAEEDKLPIVAEMFPGPNGHFYSKGAIDKLTSMGCCYCGEHIHDGEISSLKWLQFGTDYSPVCKKCSVDPAVMAELEWYQTDGQYKNGPKNRFGLYGDWE